MTNYECKVCGKEQQVKRIKKDHNGTCKSCSKKGDRNPIKKGMRTREHYDKMCPMEKKKRTAAQGRASRGFRSHGIKHDWKVIYDVIWNSPDECYYCKAPVDKLGNRTFELDHKTPPLRGGGADKNNLCVSCPKCNGTKGLMTEADYLVCLEDLKANGNW